MDEVENLKRTGDKRKFYDSPGWRRVRREALTRDRNACICCKDKGKYTRANTVHHVKEIKDVPDLALTLANLQSVCHACHESIHDRNASKRKLSKVYWPEQW